MEYTREWKQPIQLGDDCVIVESMPSRDEIVAKNNQWKHYEYLYEDRITKLHQLFRNRNQT